VDFPTCARSEDTPHILDLVITAASVTISMIQYNFKEHNYNVMPLMSFQQHTIIWLALAAASLILAVVGVNDNSQRQIYSSNGLICDWQQLGIVVHSSVEQVNCKLFVEV